MKKWKNRVLAVLLAAVTAFGPVTSPVYASSLTFTDEAEGGTGSDLIFDLDEESGDGLTFEEEEPAENVTEESEKEPSDETPVVTPVRRSVLSRAAGDSVTDNSTVVTVPDSDTSYFQMDKYAVEDEETQINRQNTWDLYLEQAYYDEEQPEVILSPAPKRQYIVLVLDQSASMSGTRVDDMNSATDTMLKRIMKLNQNRLEKARRGEYDDIDPNGDVEAQMREHLIYIGGIVGYNNHLYHEFESALAPTTDEEAQQLIDKAYIKNDYEQYYRYGRQDGDLQDMTRTDIAMQWASQRVNALGDAENTSVVLLTDGCPYGYGDEYNVTYYYESSPYTAFTVQAANDALRTARGMKDKGVTIYSIYLSYANPEQLAGAFASGDIKDVLPLLPGTHISSIFLSLLSSDFPKNGMFSYAQRAGNKVNFPVVETSNSGWYDGSDPRNFFGKYIYLPEEVNTLIDSATSIPNRVDGGATNTAKGYFGAGSIVHDEIADPFEVTTGAEIKVYQAARVPADVTGEGQKPTSIDGDGYVHSGFRWESVDEAEDITDLVAVTVENGVVEVTGYDYEAYTVTDYDKDFYRAANWSGVDRAVYERGDYGYKLIVVVPINAKVSFGGNNIETNNSDTSVFYPSDPINTDEVIRPVWTENGEYNPDGNRYVAKYPVPHVDLKLSYDIVSDSIDIYAPQTADLANLVTDVNNYMFYVDENYSNAQTERDNAYQAFLTAEAAYTAAQDALRDAAGSDTSAEDLPELNEKLGETLAAYNEALAVYNEKQAALDNCVSYIPDGVNNAFVNIEYTLQDPDGETVGTLTIPFGTPYIIDEDGGSNINWDWVDDDHLITKSGQYTISCTVTPVETPRAPGGHTSTPADPEGLQETYPPSTEYSPTGSDGLKKGQQPFTVTANPEAHIFYLKVTTTDSRRDTNQTIDFNVGVVTLDPQDAEAWNDNLHIVDVEWVCTDGTTVSDPENEPGYAETWVGEAPTSGVQISDEVIADGLVANMDGSYVVKAPDGGYVPVSMNLQRNVGILDKDVDTSDRTEMTSAVMSDSDHLYGEFSSVVWEHECSLVDDCNHYEFSEAQDKYNSERYGEIRFLIHVLDNPAPDISKDTDTPVITGDSEIKWTITMTNDDETTNTGHRSSEFTMIDILPYNGDDRTNDVTGEGSDFTGTLAYRTVTVKYSDEIGKVYATSDTNMRNGGVNEFMGSEGWTEVQPTSTNGLTATYAIPANTVAIRMDAVLGWEKTITADIMAMPNGSDNGDYYVNEAIVTVGDNLIYSNPVVTQVTNLFISGTVWEDEDADGMIGPVETRIPEIRVNLYQPFNNKNHNTPDATYGGTQLDRVYDTNGDLISPVITGTDGTFSFEDVPAGTYYIVAEYIDDDYTVTQKKAGGSDPVDGARDSEAETSFVGNNEFGNIAWIRQITVSNAGVPNQNIGLQKILGTIIVGKTLDEIYYPAAMTEEEKENYKAHFIFSLKNTDTGRVYTKDLHLDSETLHADRNGAQVSVAFEDLPLGTYELTEVKNSQYFLSNVTNETSGANVSFSSDNRTATIRLTPQIPEVTLLAENVLGNETPPGGDMSGVTNWIGMRIPVQLDVVYRGQSTVTSSTLTEYTFDANDFASIVVTYDDGTTANLTFDQVSLSPATVTNAMNGDRVVVTVYYAEKGRTVKDSFTVGVDLKPVYKYQITFDANGSTFDDGATRNAVMFAYNSATDTNAITAGTYKDVANGGLRNLGNGFTFAGWNTARDGSGYQYDGLDAISDVLDGPLKGDYGNSGATILLPALPVERSKWAG